MEEKVLQGQEREQFLREFNDGLHRLGRIMLIVATILLVAVPFVVGAINGVMPEGKGFLSGFARVAVIYIPVSIVEFLVYTPMLGAGGSYLTFLTGNVTNMKIPCVMNACDIAGTKPGSAEQEIVSTISVGAPPSTTWCPPCSAPWG